MFSCVPVCHEIIYVRMYTLIDGSDNLRRVYIAMNSANLSWYVSIPTSSILVADIRFLLKLNLANRATDSTVKLILAVPLDTWPNVNHCHAFVKYGRSNKIFDRGSSAVTCGANACAVYRRLAPTDRITEIAVVYPGGSIEIS